MGKLPKNRIPVSVGIPLDLLALLDEKVVAENYASRSEYIVQAIKEKQEREKK